MAEQPFTLTTDERAFLVEFLNEALKEARVEEHRTRTLSFREHVVQREGVISGLLTKLGQNTQ